MHPAFGRILLVLTFMTFLLILGTLGFHWVEGWTAFESFYMTLMTLTTVGYGELHPLSFQGRVLASALMLGGVVGVFISIGVLVDSIIKLELADHFGRKRRQRMIDNLSGHYIVCGAGRVGRSVIQELQRGGVSVLLVDSDAQRADWGIQEGIPTLVADATQDDTLRKARIGEARGLVAAIGNDAENVYVTLSAHVLNPALLISARATDEQAEAKLRRAGATTVLTPYAFIGHRLAQSMLRPHVLTFLDGASAFSDAGNLEIETEQIHVPQGSPLVGRSLADVHIDRNYGLILLAVRRISGETLFNPEGTLRIEEGDVLITMGERSRLRQAIAQINGTHR